MKEKNLSCCQVCEDIVPSEETALGWIEDDFTVMCLPCYRKYRSVKNLCPIDIKKYVKNGGELPVNYCPNCYTEMEYNSDTYQYECGCGHYKKMKTPQEAK